ncbi:MAG TPA: hypothetical protein VII49_09055 [Rhizomicrobium sp.]
MSDLPDLWHSIVGIVVSSDAARLSIIAVVAIGAGFAMQRISSLVTVTVGALVLFGLAVFVLDTLGGKSAASLAQSDWHNLLAMPVQTLLAYAIVFAVAIAAVYAVRSVARR